VLPSSKSRKRLQKGAVFFRFSTSFFPLFLFRFAPDGRGHPLSR
jgi:hypothetical protein